MQGQVEANNFNEYAKLSKNILLELISKVVELFYFKQRSSIYVQRHSDIVQPLHMDCTSNEWESGRCHLQEVRVRWTTVHIGSLAMT